MAEENKIRDAADAIKGVVEAVPVYQDIAQPAVKEIGVALQTVAKTIHIALAPISGMVWGYEKIKDFVGESVARRLKDIPGEQIQTPLPQVAGPALEALKYTGHDEYLREMFAKLIATSMDMSKLGQAHPSFVEIIRQLSSDEARICRFLKAGGNVPVIDINEKFEHGSYASFIKHFSLLGYKASCEFPKLVQRYTDNLVRLGLIGISFDEVLADGTSYKEIEQHADYLQIIQEMKASGKTPDIVNGVIETSVFGAVFLDACVD